MTLRFGLKPYIDTTITSSLYTFTNLNFRNVSVKVRSITNEKAITH